MVIKDVEREDVDFISRTLGCTPVAHIEQLVSEKLGSISLAEEVYVGGEGKIVKLTGLPGIE